MSEDRECIEFCNKMKKIERREMNELIAVASVVVLMSVAMVVFN